MKDQRRKERRQQRAMRLRGEAGNCLSIAIATRDAGTAAVMIDEARRLIGGAAALEAM